ncbi:DUF6630 family protein [Chryseobacterium kwangjuense]|uniref:DUF6630 domain-containing protein n=1 Tax=Chryseobacterium kwangjuense TaxID=267125 RepID=A0A135WJ26_9FLAO|nr:DUF6630 family protein [Chryseobacterium kwangjuense]KXH84875.1 hypothetical protein AU378_03720 [Chryseobacterium kwangjuense]
MEKYLRILKSFISDPRDYQEIERDFANLYNFPDEYIEHSGRLITKSDDFLWIGMVDLLLKYGYAFEVDWKEDCEVAEELLSKLFVKHNIQYTSDININQDMELDEYFSLVNKELIRHGYYRVYAMEIASDSYVVALGNIGYFQDIVDLDARVNLY